MPKRQKSTLLSKEAADAQREWYVVDLDGKVLGRAATKIASVLRGKHKPTFTPHVDSGDFVVVVNADKVVLTGQKLLDKKYHHHTGYMGGIREKSAGKMLAETPDRAVRRAVWGMLPKGPLGRKMIKKLKIYSGPAHQQGAQQPRDLAV